MTMFLSLPINELASLATRSTLIGIVDSGSGSGSCSGSSSGSSTHLFKDSALPNIMTKKTSYWLILAANQNYLIII